ncbi:MAG: GNAT family N-acetyltransferase [Planctomycetes bacterium]|nr:GNAT family N-acetyltransferase [Planctomycetota bacterium]
MRPPASLPDDPGPQRAASPDARPQLSPGWSIRLAAVGDARGLGRVHVESWQASYQGLVDPDYLKALSVSERAEGWEARLVTARGADLLLRAWWRGGRPGRTEVLLDPAGEVQGFVSYGPSRDPEPGEAKPAGELYALYVHPSAWGTGGGWALFLRCRAALRLAGFERISIWTMRGSARARAFYERQGCRLDGRQQVQRTQGIEMDLVHYTCDTRARGPWPWRSLAPIVLRRVALVSVCSLAVAAWGGERYAEALLVALVVIPAAFLEAWRTTRRGPSDWGVCVLAALGLAGLAVGVQLSGIPPRSGEAALILLIGAGSASAALGPLSGEGRSRLLTAIVLASLLPALWVLTQGTGLKDLLRAGAAGAGGFLARSVLLGRGHPPAR